MLRRFVVLLCAGTVLVVAALTALRLRADGDRAPHVAKMVKANAVRLSYLDWVGKGPVVVLLPGLNETGHVYDDLAARLVKDYRVLALTRRGCGDSDKPAGPYDTPTLVADLRGFLDALKIDRATLIGHSLAGDELTGFASAHPGRVRKLVYLDAAYDRGRPGSPFAAFARLSSEQAEAAIATPPFALASLDAYRAFYQQMLGTKDWPAAAESNLRAKVTVARNGTLTEKCPPRVTAALIRNTATTRLDPSQVKAPVLCFFAPMKGPGGALDWQRAAIQTARDTLHAQVVEMPPGTSHWLFLQHPNQVVETIQSFLAKK